MALSTALAIRVDFRQRRPRQRMPQGAQRPVANGLVIGVEEVAKLWMCGSITVRLGVRRKVSKNQVVWARCHFAGLASGIDCRLWSSMLRGEQSRIEVCRTAANARPGWARAPATTPHHELCWLRACVLKFRDFKLLTALVLRRLHKMLTPKESHK